MEEVQFRRIEASDNEALAGLIRQVLQEYEITAANSTFGDKNLDDLFGYYSGAGAAYWVIDASGSLLGGGGIAPLEGGKSDTCELQKMYLLPEARGQGLGKELFLRCLESAKALGYTWCYLETVPKMTAAQSLYRKYGFENLKSPLGNTGHSACHVWMLKKL